MAPQVISDYARGFWGYGALESGIWIIGLEEGGATSVEEVVHKIADWDRQGRPLVQDLFDVHKAAGLDRWFIGNTPLQQTWARLIRFLVAFREGKSATTDEVRAYQRERLGRRAGDHALLELLPFPSPSLRDWPYSHWTDVAWLQSRAEYERSMLPLRMEALQTLITERRPAVVLCYGFARLEYWKALGNANPVACEIGGQTAWLGKTSTTTVAIVPHPTSHQTSNQFFAEVGFRIASGAL